MVLGHGGRDRQLVRETFRFTLTADDGVRLWLTHAMIDEGMMG